MSYHFLRLRSLLEEIERILGRYQGHQVLALRARLGIDGPRTTLEDASRPAGMTRERVRQLEARFFEQFLASPAAAKLLTRIEQAGSASAEPLFLHQLPSKDRWFRRLAPDSEVVRVLLKVASAGRLDFVDVPGGAALCRAGVPPWDELVRSARAAVRSLRKGSNRRSVRNALLKILAPHGAASLVSLLLSEVEAGVQYSAAGTVVAFGSAGPVIVEAILHDADRPLHYSEVARRWSERAGEAIGEVRTNIALQDSPSAYLLGQGVYGRAKHIPLRGEAAERLVADCVEIMTRVAPRKQWHASELLDALAAAGRLPSSKVDKYVIDACLSQSGKLRSLGRLVWTLPRPGNAAERIDVQQAAFEALVRAGRPLHDDELRREIARARGLNDALVIVTPTEHMARTARSTWGLVDRDFLLSRPQRQAVIEAICAEIERRGSALHLTEIGAVAERIRLPVGVTPYMLMQLAALDGRMKLFYGYLLGLSDWPDARRLNLSAAMASIASAVRSPVTLDWVHAELERVVGRPLRRSVIQIVLQRSALRYDSERRVWATAPP